MKIKPIAVLLSDVHYNINTLELADAATRQAIAKANELGAQLIIAGDLHDTKANLRGECTNALIETMGLANMKPLILIGNHDRLNEKHPAHALNFLKDCTSLVDTPAETKRFGWLLPYFHDAEELKVLLARIPKNSQVIMHQGLKETNSGNYIQDKSAVSKEDAAGLHIISGHYHCRQTISLPGGGTWRYIGNPYTLSYGEAADPDKGYQILYDDGSMRFIPTNLRKHVVVSIDDKLIGPEYKVYSDNDLVWAKVTCHKHLAKQITRQTIQEKLSLPKNFKLDFEYIDTVTGTPAKTLTKSELFDSLIDALIDVSDSHKTHLKNKWRELV